MATYHQIHHRNLRFIILGLGLVLAVLFIHKCSREGLLIERPKGEQTSRLTKEILNSKHLFAESFSVAKKAMPWLDPVIYEDVRGLVLNNNANEHTISKVL
jgi:hypothetical protein